MAQPSMFIQQSYLQNDGNDDACKIGFKSYTCTCDLMDPTTTYILQFNCCHAIRHLDIVICAMVKVTCLIWLCRHVSHKSPMPLCSYVSQCHEKDWTQHLLGLDQLLNHPTTHSSCDKYYHHKNIIMIIYYLAHYNVLI